MSLLLTWVNNGFILEQEIKREQPNNQSNQTPNIGNRERNTWGLRLWRSTLGEDC